MYLEPYLSRGRERLTLLICIVIPVLLLRRGHAFYNFPHIDHWFLPLQARLVILRRFLVCRRNYPFIYQIGHYAILVYFFWKRLAPNFFLNLLSHLYGSPVAGFFQVIRNRAILRESSPAVRSYFRHTALEFGYGLTPRWNNLPHEWVTYRCLSTSFGLSWSLDPFFKIRSYPDLVWYRNIPRLVTLTASLTDHKYICFTVATLFVDLWKYYFSAILLCFFILELKLLVQLFFTLRFLRRVSSRVELQWLTPHRVDLPAYFVHLFKIK